ncbi:MAG: hypothetical protein R2939_22050 [Kofleriaceae bacterium]
MKTTIVSVGALAVVAGCAGAAPTAPRVIYGAAAFGVDVSTERACQPRSADGEPAMLTTAVGEGTRFAAIETSPLGPHAGAYVRVEGHGRRSLQLGKEARAFGCTQRPLTDDASQCPVISTAAFGAAVEASLQAIGIAAVGPELGVGGELNWDPATPQGHEAWHMSVRIADWADADAALAVVARALDAWGIGSPFGVSVVGQVCPDAEPVMLEYIDELR